MPVGVSYCISYVQYNAAVCPGERMHVEYVHTQYRHGTRATSTPYFRTLETHPVSKAVIQ